ncbi:hypothetical protein ACTFIY_004128 [Dictyostelium cf. discoideum]
MLKRGGQEFLETPWSGIWEALCHQISTTSEIELSPHGIIHSLRVIYEVLSLDTDHIPYLRIKEWPSLQMGSASGISALANQILYLPLSKTSLCYSHKVSQDNYKAMHRSDLYGLLKKLLAHPEATVRAKTCNLIGNMFKYNGYFYQHFQKSGILPILIPRCIDLNTRKFACFALGNAAFHSSDLYDELDDSIPINI